MDPAGQIFFGELSGARAKIEKVRENPVFCNLFTEDECTIGLNPVENSFSALVTANLQSS